MVILYNYPINCTQVCHVIITLDPRLPFPDSVGEICSGPASTSTRVLTIECFSQLAATMNDSFSMLIRGITAVDWHILLSCYVKLDIFPSWECDDSPKLCFSS